MTFEQESAQHLVDLYDQRILLTEAAARHPRMTGEMVQQVMDKGDELKAACEEFRLQFYPRQDRIFVGLRQVMAESAAPRSTSLVYSPEAISR